jgi:2-isopropylmalate synthase
MKHDYHLDVPRRMQIELSRVVQEVADTDGGEIAPARIWELFRQTYLDRRAPLRLISYAIDSGGSDSAAGTDRIRATVSYAGAEREITGEGNGPIAALVHALAELDIDARVLDYHEHATGAGEEAQAAAYLEVAVEGTVLWGCGVSPSITTASLYALVSAVNRG